MLCQFPKGNSLERCNCFCRWGGVAKRILCLTELRGEALKLAVRRVQTVHALCLVK